MNMTSITQFFRWKRTVKIKRFELLLPMTYNTGVEIEQEKLDQTALELTNQFPGLTQDLVRLHGLWKFAGAVFRDRLLRIRVDSGNPGAVTYLRSYKVTLKERFAQLDIWITAHEIEII